MLVNVARERCQTLGGTDNFNSKRMSNPQLSLCMIARDEELLLRQAIESVSNVVDEIVVDTGSVDTLARLNVGRTLFSLGHDDEALHHLDRAGRLLRHPPKEYPAVVADPVSIEAQFNACTTLASSARAFDLVLGRSLERLPQLVEAAFE